MREGERGGERRERCKEEDRREGMAILLIFLSLVNFKKQLVYICLHALK